MWNNDATKSRGMREKWWKQKTKTINSFICVHRSNENYKNSRERARARHFRSISSPRSMAFLWSTIYNFFHSFRCASVKFAANICIHWFDSTAHRQIKSHHFCAVDWFALIDWRLRMQTKSKTNDVKSGSEENVEQMEIKRENCYAILPFSMETKQAKTDPKRQRANATKIVSLNLNGISHSIDCI